MGFVKSADLKQPISKDSVKLPAVFCRFIFFLLLLKIKTYQDVNECTFKEKGYRHFINCFFITSADSVFNLDIDNDPFYRYE